MAIDATISLTSSVLVTTTATTLTGEANRQDTLATSLAANSPANGSAGGNSVSSPEQSRAYLRQMKAVHDAVTAAAAKMTFTSSAAARDFTVATGNGLLAALHKGSRGDLTSLLQDLPNEALAAASKSLATNEARDANVDRLLKTLSDFINEIKSSRAAFTKIGGKTNLFT